MFVWFCWLFDCGKYSWWFHDSFNFSWCTIQWGVRKEMLYFQEGCSKLLSSCSLLVEVRSQLKTQGSHPWASQRKHHRFLRTKKHSFWTVACRLPFPLATGKKRIVLFENLNETTFSRHLPQPVKHIYSLCKQKNWQNGKTKALRQFHQDKWY